MKIINCDQGSPEWFKARAGVITASNFEECCKTLKSGKNKGEHSAKAKEYAFRLAVERISGELLDEDKFDTFEMRRGRELEPEARFAHEEKMQILVEQTGFALTDSGLYGASVDGFIDETGTSEYKCFISPKSSMPILLDNDYSDIEAQIQGQMWVTERQWCDFVLYCPALKSIDRDLTIITVQRDDKYIEEMEGDLNKFNNLVVEFMGKLIK